INSLRNDRENLQRELDAERTKMQQLMNQFQQLKSDSAIITKLQQDLLTAKITIEQAEQRLQIELKNQENRLTAEYAQKLKNISDELQNNNAILAADAKDLRSRLL